MTTHSKPNCVVSDVSASDASVAGRGRFYKSRMHGNISHAHEPDTGKQ